jgi:hypothetical protein
VKLHGLQDELPNAACLRPRCEGRHIAARGVAVAGSDFYDVALDRVGCRGSGIGQHDLELTFLKPGALGANPKMIASP